VIVALVCSAGGLKALTAILAVLPGDFPAAVIVLQHQSPGPGNPLARLLKGSCRLEVSTVTEGTPLQAGRVVVVPPGKHALVTSDNQMALIATDGPPPYRPSADLLLTSLALVAARRSIAVILSGGGTDGATGAAALHHLGGVILASDRTSSEHFGMPGAAIGRDKVVDWVLPLDSIAPKLVSLLGARRDSSGSTD
jgi:two-component system, chemotaxis family, protein-glutamate methylesterase/glutaminase